MINVLYIVIVSELNCISAFPQKWNCKQEEIDFSCNIEWYRMVCKYTSSDVGGN